MSLYDEAILIQKPSGYKAGKLYNVKPSPEVTEQSSVEFDGVDDCLITDGDSVAQPTTYSFWAKSSETGVNRGIFGHGSASMGAFHFNWNSKPLLYLGGGYYRFWVDNSAQDDGEWHHWVVYSDTNDITNSKLYCDGVLQDVSSTDNSGSLNAYTEGLTIGGYKQSSGHYFNGSISDFAVFSRELSAADVTEIYNYGSPNDLLLPASYGTDISQSSTKSVEFDGVDDYLIVGDSSSLDFASSFSVSFWIYPKSISSNDRMVCKGVTGTGEWMISFNSDQAIRVYTKDNDDEVLDFASTNTLTVNEWAMVTVVVNRTSNKLQVYKNGGNLNESAATWTSGWSNSAALTMGVNSNLAGNFEGSIDNVGIYDKALTQAEITRQYNGGQPIDLSTDATSDSLVAYYKMGDGTLDSYPLIADQTDTTLGNDVVEANTADLGSFDTDTTSLWTANNAIAYNSATKDASVTHDGSGAWIMARNFLTSGQVYKATFKAKATANTSYLSLTNGSGAGHYYGATLNPALSTSYQNYEFLFKTTSTWLEFSASSSATLYSGDVPDSEDTFTFDDIVVKEVQGNPAIMTNMSSSDITTDVALSVVNDLDLYYQMGNGILDDYPLIADQTNATLGSELVTNGDFDTDSYWTKQTGWSISGGTANFNGASGYSLYGSANWTIGAIYMFNYDVLNYVSGGVRISFDGNLSETISSNSTNNTFYRMYEGGNTNIFIQSVGSSQFSIDNVSVKQVNGNPSMMTNMSSADIVAWTPNLETDFDVARSSWTTRRNASGYIEQVAPNVPRLNYDSGDSCPYLLTEDAGTNLITYPISFGNSYWTKSGASIEGDSSTSGSELNQPFSDSYDYATSGSDGNWQKYNTTSNASTDANGKLTVVVTATNDGVDNDPNTIVTEEGKIYHLTGDITLTGVTGGEKVRINLVPDGESLADIYVSDDEALDYYFIATGTTLRLIIGANTYVDGFTFTADNISVKEVQGFEAPKEIPVANGEELVTNGDFSSNTGGLGTDWQINAAALTPSIVDGQRITYKASLSGYNYRIFQDAVFESNKIYQLKFSIKGNGTPVSNGIMIKQGAGGTRYGLTGLFSVTTSFVEHTLIVKTSDTATYGTSLNFAGGHYGAWSSTSDFLEIDNVSVKEVTSYSGGGFEREAYKLVEDTSSGNHTIYALNAVTPSGTQTFTLSTYVKDGGSRYFSMALTDNVKTASFYTFDLQTGTNTQGIDDGTPSTYSIESMPNGWYRISLTTEATYTSKIHPRFYIENTGTPSAPNGNTYTGDGTSGIYIAYAQLEESDYASSLMLPVTEGSTTSRVADAITGGGNQSLFSGVNSSGVLYAEIAANSDDLTGRYISLSDGTNNNRINIYYPPISNGIYYYIGVGGIKSAGSGYSVTDTTDSHKVAVRYAENDFSLWIDGVERLTDTSGITFPSGTLSSLALNSGGSGSRFYGKTKAVAVFDYLSDDQMVKLTEEGYNTFNALATANNFIIR